MLLLGSIRSIMMICIENKIIDTFNCLPSISITQYWHFCKRLYNGIYPKLSINIVTHEKDSSINVII